MYSDHKVAVVIIMCLMITRWQHLKCDYVHRGALLCLHLWDHVCMSITVLENPNNCYVIRNSNSDIDPRLIYTNNTKDGKNSFCYSHKTYKFILIS